LWRLDLDTQASTKLLERPGILDICETPDGSALYFLQGEDLMRGKLDGGVFAGEPVRVESNVVAFALVPGAVYVRTREGAIMRRDAVGGSARLVLQTDGSFGPGNLGFTVSKDERWLVYSRWGRWEMDLKLLEGNE
jgi:hypothetical protein